MKAKELENQLNSVQVGYGYNSGVNYLLKLNGYILIEILKKLEESD